MNMDRGEKEGEEEGLLTCPALSFGGGVMKEKQKKIILLLK